MRRTTAESGYDSVMNARRFLATFGIAASLATTATVLPAALPEADAARVSWAAIAYDYYGAVGGGYNFRTQSGAIAEAKRRCGPQCGYFTFHNTCGAIAFNFQYGRTYVGKSWGYPDHKSAERRAIAEAGGRAGKVRSLCSRG